MDWSSEDALKEAQKAVANGERQILILTTEPKKEGIRLIMAGLTVSQSIRILEETKISIMGPSFFVQPED